MGRRPNIEPITRLEISIPETQRAKLDILLWSDVEQCVPRGVYSQFFLGLLDRYLAQLENASVRPANSE